MNTKNLRLGSMELKLLFELEKEERRVFETRDAYRILGTGKDSVNTVLYRLRKKGRIETIERGRYLLVPARAGYDAMWAEVPLVLASHLVDPYYVGFASALNHWGMTEQIPSITYVVTTKRKRPVVVGPLRFEFSTLASKKLFGAVKTVVDGEDILISSKEKTIIDCLLYPRYCGGLDEVAKGMWLAWDEMNPEKILKYADKIGVDIVRRRLFYMLDILGLDDGSVDDALQSHKPKGYMLLDPAWISAKPEYSKKYGLILNRSKQSLTRWMGY